MVNHGQPGQMLHCHKDSIDMKIDWFHIPLGSYSLGVLVLIPWVYNTNPLGLLFPRVHYSLGL